MARAVPPGTLSLFDDGASGAQHIHHGGQRIRRRLNLSLRAKDVDERGVRLGRVSSAASAGCRRLLAIAPASRPWRPGGPDVGCRSPDWLDSWRLFDVRGANGASSGPVLSRDMNGRRGSDRFNPLPVRFGHIPRNKPRASRLRVQPHFRVIFLAKARRSKDAVGVVEFVKWLALPVDPCGASVWNDFARCQYAWSTIAPSAPGCESEHFVMRPRCHVRLPSPVQPLLPQEKRGPIAASFRGPLTAESEAAKAGPNGPPVPIAHHRRRQPRLNWWCYAHGACPPLWKSGSAMTLCRNLAPPSSTGAASRFSCVLAAVAPSPTMMCTTQNLRLPDPEESRE